jgi:hypothetical protein
LLELFTVRRWLMVAALSVSLAVGTLPTAVSAEAGYPDFYGTVLLADRETGKVTLLTETDGPITVDVRDLGATPFDEGAFALDSIVLLRTRQVGDSFVAIGWEQSRNGDDRLKGGS